ncbi:MAG: hypothetical protein Q9218_007435 [Villophora microphyllina]
MPVQTVTGILLFREHGSQPNKNAQVEYKITFGADDHHLYIPKLMLALLAVLEAVTKMSLLLMCCFAIRNAAVSRAELGQQPGIWLSGDPSSHLGQPFFFLNSGYPSLVGSQIPGSLGSGSFDDCVELGGPDEADMKPTPQWRARRVGEEIVSR